MLFSVKNLGLIDEAEIKLDGITVITGENNVGKSTIGKMLYCVNNVFLYGNIEAVKVNRIKRAIINHFRDGQYPPQITRRINELTQGSKFLLSLLYDKGWFDKSEHSLQSFFAQNLTDSSGRSLTTPFFGDEFINDLEMKILKIIDMDDNQLRSDLISIAIEWNFSGVTHNIYSENNLTEIGLKLDDSEHHIKISATGEILIASSRDIALAEAIYIESPRVAQDSEKEIIDFNADSRQRVLKLLTEESDADFWEAKETTIEIKNILNKISVLAPGNLVKKDSFSNKLEYEEDGRRFDLKNVSNGVKTFAILKKLLYNSKLKRNGMLILDEPEIHLHPEWQLVFAEVLVLLRRQYNLRILINTHSFYFLAAIEDYSKIHEIDQNCNYYLVERKENHSSVSDHTNTLNELYLRFSEPMDELENQVR